MLSKAVTDGKVDVFDKNGVQGEPLVNVCDFASLCEQAVSLLRWSHAGQLSVKQYCRVDLGSRFAASKLFKEVVEDLRI